MAAAEPEALSHAGNAIMTELLDVMLGTALENHLMIAEALIGGLHSAAGRIERQGDQARAEINRLMRDLDGSEIADVELQDAVRNGAVSLMLTYL